MSEDPTRRDVVKKIGAAAGVAAVGAAQPVAAERATDVLDRDEVRLALEEAGVETAALDQGASTTEVVRSETWVKIPVATDAAEYVASNETDTAEVVTGDNSVVRATVDDDGRRVENLEMGQQVVDETFRTIDDRDLRRVMDEADVVSLVREDADAHVDHTTGTRRLFVDGETQSGETAGLLLEVEADGSVSSGFDLSTRDGVSTTESAIDCWVNCITWGTFCSTPCTVCVADPTRISCAPCAVCIGGTATVCAAKCGIEQFW